MIQSQENFAQRLRIGADRIYNLIMHSDLEWIDIEIEINQLRDFCRENHPEKLPLFEAVYASRFSRLWDQWRLEGDTSWTWRESADDPSTMM